MVFIIWSFILWRILLFFVAFLGQTYIPFQPSFPYSDIFLIHSGLPRWIWSFANFDGVHYLTIAQNGYSAQFTQVFFPLYPLVIHLTHFFFPFVGYLPLGLILSNIFFFLSLFILFHLLRIDYSFQTGIWIVLFFIFSPTSYYFGSLYTESFFILLILSSFFCARKKKWFWAGILAMLSTMTRLTGIFLFPALVMELILQNKSVFFDKKSQLKSKLWITLINFLWKNKRTLFYICLIPLGIVFYGVYLQIYFGDWLYFWHAQPAFGAQRSGSGIVLLPQVVWRYLKILVTIPITREAFWISGLELFSTIYAFVLLIWGYRKRIRLSYIIFSICSLLLPTLTGTLSSMPRYILVAIACFIALGLIRSTMWKMLILFVDMCLLIILTLLFTSGSWVG